MASGHVNRENRPNTWQLRPTPLSEDSPCQPGAVHTWAQPGPTGMSAIPPLLWDKRTSIPPSLNASNKRAAHLHAFNGPFKAQGMPDFTGKLKEEDLLKITAFIQGTADAIRPKPAAK